MADYTLWGFTAFNDMKEALEREGEGDQMLYAVSKMDFHNMPAFEDDGEDYARMDAYTTARHLRSVNQHFFICVDNSAGITAFTVA